MVDTITQSLAIIEFLETLHNGACKLYPADPFRRARMQEIVYSIVCDIHPVQNLRVLQSYPEEQRAARAKDVIETGLRAVERLLHKTAVGQDAGEEQQGCYCVDNALSVADVVLVPQVYNAYRFQVDMTQFPRVVSIYEHLMTLTAFRASHPDEQPDAPAKQ